MRVIYADNNATTAVDPEVFEAMRPFLTGRYGNPSSIHSFGSDVTGDLERAREQLAECVGAEHTTEIVLTSCGTEADNTAIRSHERTSSSNSDEIIRTATPAPDSSAMMSSISDLAPRSIPRVGSSRIIRIGCLHNQRASRTFC